MKTSAKKSAPAVRRPVSSPDPPLRLACLLLALTTILVYLPAGFHDYIFFDDPSYVADNPVVQSGLTWESLKWDVAGWHAGNWHPLTWLSLELDCQLFGANPGAEHLVNVLFHAANTALLFLLWRRLAKSFWPAVMVAALFAWHPLHVESVAWIAERKDVLSAFFGLLALLAYVRHAERRTGTAKFFPGGGIYWLAVLLFALGLMSKPMLVTLPFLLLLLDYWPLQQLFAPAAPGVRWSLAWEKWPFFLLAAASCAVTFLAQRGQAVVSLRQYTPGLRLENALVSCERYLFKTIWPANLGVFYPLRDRLAPGEVALAAALLLTLSWFAWRWRRPRPYFLTGWLWFLGMLVPVIGLVQAGHQAMADRYTYLPSVGLFVMAVFGIAEAGSRLKLPPAVVPLGATLILAACVAGTERQLTFWRDTQTLFAHTLAVTGANGPAHLMLGVARERLDHPDEALPQYQEALSCDASLIVQVAGGESRPLAAQVQLLLGQAAERKGQPGDALDHYRAALALDSNLIEALNNAGNLLDELGQPDAALQDYEAAVRLRPDLPLVHENLGTQLLELNRFGDAMREYGEAARLDPAGARPHYLMGKARLRRGQDAEAAAEFQEALRRNADDDQSLAFLARILAADENPQLRNGTQAVALAEKANELTGGARPFVLGTLAMAYAEAGRFPDARQTATAALQLAATNPPEAPALQQQLRSYQSDRPWRENFTNPPAPAAH